MSHNICTIVVSISRSGEVSALLAYYVSVFIPSKIVKLILELIGLTEVNVCVMSDVAIV